LRLAAIPFALLGVYYARFFFLVRQETTTLLQIGLLLAAIAVVLLPGAARPNMRTGRRPAGGGWVRSPLAGWAIALTALALAILVFTWADRDSHSVSDTLTRSVPTLCLILALTLRLLPERPRRRTSRLA
jgi:hypothetical protein